MSGTKRNSKFAFGGGASAVPCIRTRSRKSSVTTETTPDKDTASGFGSATWSGFGTKSTTAVADSTTTPDKDTASGFGGFGTSSTGFGGTSFSRSKTTTTSTIPAHETFHNHHYLRCIGSPTCTEGIHYSVYCGQGFSSKRLLLCTTHYNQAISYGTTLT